MNLSKKIFCLIALIVITNLSNIYAQVVDQLYNSKLQIQPIKPIEESVTLIISDGSCIGCVEYLLNLKICRYIILDLKNLDVLLLKEYANRLHFDEANIFLHIGDKFKSLQSPRLLYNNVYIMEYDQINTLTSDFTLSRRQSKRNLKTPLNKVFVKSSPQSTRSV